MFIFFPSPLEATHKSCLERKDRRIWGQLKAQAQGKHDSAKPEAGDRAGGGQTQPIHKIYARDAP